MSTRPARHLLANALFAAALAACGGDGDAAESAGGGEPAVYTSEVESVSRWIQQGGGSADSAGLVATPNPRGEGVLVYSRSDSAAGGQRAAWVVVDSQVVPLNRASRRAAPQQAQQPRDDERTWQRIGIERTGGEADLRDILPVPEAPRERTAPRERQAPKQRETPAVPTPDATAPVPFPAEPPTPRATGPRDTLRIPAGSGGAGGARRDSSAGDPVRAPDSLRVPVTRPARDTIRIPGPSAGESAPAAEPQAAPAAPVTSLPGA